MLNMVCVICTIRIDGHLVFTSSTCLCCILFVLTKMIRVDIIKWFLKILLPKAEPGQDILNPIWPRILIASVSCIRTFIHVLLSPWIDNSRAPCWN